LYKSKRSLEKNIGSIALVLAMLGWFCAAGAQPPAKEPPPPKPAPIKAPPIKAPAVPGRPAAPAAAHGPAANNPGNVRPITTNNPGSARPITTNNPGNARPITTNNPGSARPATTGNPGNARPTTANPGAAPGAGAPVAPSKAFAGRPGPAGSREVHAPNGAILRQRANGSVADIHDPKRGMDIHRGMNGDRRVMVERPDHSRVFVGHGRDGYIQQRYVFHGREFGHRSYYVNGRVYDRFYRPYPYRGAYLEVYAPARYYPVGFYGWAYQPWRRPVPYAWGWAGNPWYGRYGYYFAPYPVYSSASFWLTDYLIAASLQAAYVSAQNNPAPAPAPVAGGPPALTPEVKQMIADEVKRQVEQSAAEAQANQQHPGVEPAGGGIIPLLSDNRPHVFVAGSDMDLVDTTGRECMISQGDVVQVVGVPSNAAGTANAVVMASKGGAECAPAAGVEIPLATLQEMQNHMRETLDQGMAELQAKQGQGGLPSAPPAATGAAVPAAFAVGAPPPDANVGGEIAQTAQAADQTEQGAGAAASADSSPIPAAVQPGASPVQISLGQSIESVTAAMGAPARIIDLGAKKIYTYPDMKVIFTNGQVSDVQ
jgi:hypothetical protein